ncbi:phospholipase A(1) DAD1, chloroplastic [Vigna radiata var. radiata]|uniref:Phospholipase A(1) DAD1, chloroplastic n=1 Tax=Vigna radiata var. radiata TaxID=3916 RepID=A0A1S3VB11_VIGRR|nr:phospholipase A(1) DAD1, chloroplastic [Vigna radiata var. radiata]
MKLAMRVASIQPRTSSSISQNNPTCPFFESNISSQFSKSLPSPSTKCNFPKLRQKWKQYQGIDHWEGGLVVTGEEDAPMVQKGFFSLYTSKTSTRASLQEMIRKEIGRVIQKYTNEPLSLTLTGHSLGAALAILSAYDITTTFQNAPMVTVISFGGPRVGNDSFRKQLEQKGIKILRIVNSDDVVTKVPGFILNLDEFVNNEDVGVGIWSRWLYKYIENMQLEYVDIGQELRLSSREFPCLNRRDVVMCHDLKTYLHLVKNFVSSSCACKHKKIHSIQS